MDKNMLFWLFELYHKGTASPAQVRELMELIKDAPDDEISELLLKTWNTQSVDNDFFTSDTRTKLLNRLQPAEDLGKTEVTSEVVPVKGMLLKRPIVWWAAAAVLLLAGALFYSRQQTSSMQNREQIAAKPDLLPGKTGAILTLANGKQVVLDSMQNGVIARQDGMNVRLKDGVVAYVQGDHPAGEANAGGMNTMSTPNGRLYQLKLPDGTAVWLNAASSITYPTTFSHSERKVSIMGEAYFEVAKDAKKPFRVSIADRAVVEVLGTRFNINAYANERDIRTSLLEGSVNVNGMVITPGQQAIVTEKDGVQVDKNPDLESVMAWKNGQFKFSGTDLAGIMREVERWYDVEVIFKGNISHEKFIGTIPRDITFSQFMKVLSLNDVKFEIKGNKLYIINGVSK